MSQLYRLFVGIDWANEEHNVCVLDSQQMVVGRRLVRHSGAEIEQLGAWLAQLSAGDHTCLAVAIEMPRGAVVDTLVERGFAVYSLNPKQMDRFRDRHTVAGAKDDRRDAFVLADALRTDQHLFRRVRFDDPLVIRIRELCRAEEDIQHEQVRAENQVRDLLNRYYPQLLSLCPAVNEPWFWSLIEMVPLPVQTGRLSRSKIEKLLSSHHIRRWAAGDIQQALGVAALPLSPGTAEAASEHVLLLLPILRLFFQQRKELERRMEALLDEMSTEEKFGAYRDVVILRSLPGVGRIITATILAEASQLLAERDYYALRSYGGVAPITRQSGKYKSVSMRYGCNQRLRNAVYHWCRVSTQREPRSRLHYTELRAKGHSHGRALRGVADRLLSMLIAMLVSGTTYDPARRASVAAS